MSKTTIAMSKVQLQKVKNFEKTVFFFSVLLFGAGLAMDLLQHIGDLCIILYKSEQMRSVKILPLRSWKVTYSEKVRAH